MLTYYPTAVLTLFFTCGKVEKVFHSCGKLFGFFTKKLYFQQKNQI